MRISKYPKNLTIAIGSEDLSQLRELSEKYRLSIGHLVRESIKKWLDEREQQAGTN